MSCCTCYLAFAQDAQEEMVVTGTRTDLQLKDSPVRIEVVSQKDLKRLHAYTIKDALDNVPGVTLRRIHGRSGYEVYMQGYDADRVLVLVDGEEVPASTGSSVDVMQISTAGVERIEVVKGASSALYGSSAMGGVINIITQDPPEGNSARISGDLGSYRNQNGNGKTESPERRRLNVQAASVVKQAYINTNLNVVDTNGFKVNPTAWNQQGAGGTRLSANVEAGFMPTGSQDYYVYARYYDEDLGANITPLIPGLTPEQKFRSLQIKHEEVKRLKIGGGGEIEIDDTNTLTARFYDQNYQSDTYRSNPNIENTPLYKPRFAEINQQKVYLQLDSQLNAKGVITDHVVTSGIEYYQADLTQDIEDRCELKKTQSSEACNQDRNNTSLFVQSHLYLNDNLQLVPGFRYQYDSDFGKFFAPKLNLRYDINQKNGSTAFYRLGISKGYRVPNLKERYFVFDHSHLGYMVLGNPDLQPESANSINLEYGAYYNSGAELNLNAFYSKAKDLIATDFAFVDTSGVANYLYTNVESTLMRGIELSGRISLGHVSLQGGYTYLVAKDKKTGNLLPKRPKHQLKTEFLFQLDKLSASLLMNWQSDEFVELDNRLKSRGYRTFDFKVNAEVMKSLSVYFGIDNLTHVQRTFSDRSDLRPEEGRMTYIGFQFQTY